MGQKVVIRSTKTGAEAIVAKNIVMNANLDEGTLGVTFNKEFTLADDSVQSMPVNIHFYGVHYSPETADVATKARYANVTKALEKIFVAINDFIKAEEAVSAIKDK